MKCFTGLLLLALVAGIRSAPAADQSSSPLPQAFSTEFATQQPEQFTTLAATEEQLQEEDRRLGFKGLKDLWDQLDRMNKDFESRFRKQFQEAEDRLRDLRKRLEQDREQFASYGFEGDNWKVPMPLKNFKPEDFDVKIENGYLKIKAHREDNETNLVSDLSREYSLPKNVDLDAAKCQFHDGQLEVLIPKKDDYQGDRNALRTLQCQMDADLLAANNVAFFQTELDEFRANLNLKNFKPEEVKVSLENGFMKIEGHHEEQKEENGHKFSLSSSVHRQFLLPENVDFDAAKCLFHQDGKLEITLPRQDNYTGDRKALRQLQCQTDAELLNEANVALFKMEDQEFKVKLGMKLFKPEELKVSVQNGMVVVEAHKQVKKEEKGKFQFSFDLSRSFGLPENVNLDNGKCFLNKDGFLEVSFPRQDDFQGDRNALRQLNCEVEKVEEPVTEAPKKEEEKKELAEQLQQNNVAFFKTEDQEFKLTFGLQNFKPEELKVTLEKGTVKVMGQHEEQKEVNGHKLTLSSSFNRQYTLPENVDFDAASCKFKEGKLEFVAPRQDTYAGDRNKLRELTCQTEAEPLNETTVATPAMTTQAPLATQAA